MFSKKKFQCISEDFEICGGTLIRYHGDGGYVATPEGVESISRSAFMGCRELRGIYVGEGVKRIESAAFLGCDGLTDIYLSDTVSKFGNRCFGKCTALKNVRLPDGLCLKINYFLIDLDSVPEYLFINPVALGALRGQFRKAAVRGFLHRLEHGDGDASVEAVLQNEILKNGERLALEFDGYLLFFRYALSLPQLSAELLNGMLRSTQSLECRALILEYRNEMTQRQQRETAWREL